MRDNCLLCDTPLTADEKSSRGHTCDACEELLTDKIQSRANTTSRSIEIFGFAGIAGILAVTPFMVDMPVLMKVVLWVVAATFADIALHYALKGRRS